MKTAAPSLPVLDSQLETFKIIRKNYEGKALAILFLYAMSLAAQSPEFVTDRPDLTESALVVPKNFLQIETGSLVSIADEPANRLAG